MTSIRKLAELAGVSPITVSRALRNVSYVRPELRQRILELADLYKYRPPRPQPNSVSGATRCIGCLVAHVNDSFRAQLLSGILEGAFSESYHISILETHGLLTHTQKAIEVMIEQHVDGLILDCGHFEPVPKESILALRSHGIAAVTLDTTTGAMPIDHVSTDEEQFGEIAVDYLYALGHREIAYLGHIPKGRLIGRALSIQQALRRHGITTGKFVHSHFVEDVSVVLDELMAQSHPPTAIIGMSDEFATSVIQYILSAGGRVPKDLSVIGAGNCYISQFIFPPLTTIEQSPEEIGRRAVQLIFKRLEERENNTASPFEHVKLAPRLIERKSCAKPHLVSR